jgi:ABC-2 type transport system permease protein
MTPAQTYTSFYTIIRKDVIRIFRIWPQTFLPPIVTSVLYFLIFGAFLGSRIGEVGGVPYITFVIPGLVMLSVITNAYSNVATVVFQSKFFVRNIDEILVSPTPPWVIVAAFATTGVIRGMLTGILVLLTSLFFSDLVIANLFVVLAFLVLTSLVFALAGLVNGVYAKGFDSITIVPTFVLTPLVYLGGVFYSVATLPAFWQAFSHINPVFYIINGFRYGFLGFADVSLWISFGVLIGFAVVLAAINWYIIKTGLGLRQ